MRSVKVSVVIPAFNAGRWVARAIDSVLAQDWPNVEVIVVNDGSTDNTDEVCRSYGERIRYVRQENAGVSAARNRGIELAEGQLIAFLDADDQFLPSMVSTLVRALENFPEAGAASGAHFLRTGDSLVRVPPEGRVLPPGVKIGVVHDFFRVYAKWSIVCTGSVLVKKEVFDKVGLFRPDLRLGEDIEMWSRIAGRFPWVFVDEPVAVYNRNPESSVTMRSRLSFDFSFIYDEDEMRKQVREELWVGYRVFRREQILMRCRYLLKYGATGEVRAALRRISPAPPTFEWLMINVLSFFPPWMAKTVVYSVINLKRIKRRLLR
jgi:glycosyltransferase involved in cell wall biosynthesis